MNSKMLQVARREFVSTVATKGFIIGVLIVPLIMVGAIVLIPRLINDKPPAYNGTIAIIDRSGWEGTAEVPTIPEVIRSRYTPEALAAEQAAARAALEAQAKSMAPAGPLGKAAAEQAAKQVAGEVPRIEVEVLPADADVEAEKAKLLEGSAQDGGRLALVVIDPYSVRRADETLPFAAYDMFLRSRIDDRFERPLRDKVGEAIVAARVQAAGENLAEIRELTRMGADRSTVITETGERKSSGGGESLLLAIGFMMLIWISVFTGGQYLMTTVIEEKSSRVMEVLLSAVSPRQLMTGKIIGQMCVALTILGVYLVLGVVGLQQFNMLDLLSAGNLGLLIAYFFIAFFLIGAMMAAIGSAVTEIREAQAMMTPMMLVLMIPMMLWMPLARNPNSTFSTVVGFIPPVSPFAMVIRMGGSEPIPMWQHAAAIAIGIVSVYVATWATAKIFRIGVLMYGKPPNFRTLMKWVRMA